jgi:hypothetical protein
MIITRRNVRPALLQDETAQADPTADLKNAFAGDRELAHLFRERAPGRPDDAKEWP